MKAAEYSTWYEDLLQRWTQVPRHRDDGYNLPTFWYDSEGAQAWASEAASALAAVFPPHHPCRITWDRLAMKMEPRCVHGETLEEMLGVFRAAAQQLRDNRIGSLQDAVRVETEDELLDQASVLLRAGHLAAAAVIAGGSLETHLRHLVAKHGLTITGEGSISKYDAAIGKARNDGTATAYSATDGKLVMGWGGVRNDAAHNPAGFDRSSDDVRRMIEGIREFIARFS